MKIHLPRGFTAFFGALMIRLLGLTWRIEWRGMENYAAARGMSKQVIFAFWHGRLLVLSFSHRGRRIQVLASEHQDGDLMGRAITWLGFGHLRGSTSRGGARALRELAKILEEGLDVGLTVDGPRGPRGVLHQGAVELSRMTGSAVVPVSNTARPRKLFRSWDRFQLPGPFSRVTVAYGEPMLVPDGADQEERERLRLELQRGLNELTTALDSASGFTGEEAWPHADP
jgi:lysophospholipid acyltransferase (LPLAT)-like uncharacterized protein